MAASDFAELEKHGFTDAEVFDIAAAVALTVGRQIESKGGAGACIPA